MIDEILDIVAKRFDSQKYDKLKTEYELVINLSDLSIILFVRKILFKLDLKLILSSGTDIFKIIFYSEKYKIYKDSLIKSKKCILVDLDEFLRAWRNELKIIKFESLRQIEAELNRSLVRAPVNGTTVSVWFGLFILFSLFGNQHSQRQFLSVFENFCSFDLIIKTGRTAEENERAFLTLVKLSQK